MSEEKNFRILSLSGGGFLGLYTIAVLEKIEENLGSPIARNFDLIAGVSVGGIIALALANEIPAREIRRIFEQNGARIFSHKPKSKGFAKLFETALCLASHKHNVKALNETLKLFYGDKTLGDLQHAVLIPTINLTNSATHFFKTPNELEFKRDGHLKLLDIALAASAAPIFFPLVEIENELFCDGGLFCNSPDLAALHEAEFFFGAKIDQIKMLSIGTTTANFSLENHSNFLLGNKDKNFGILDWLKDERILRTAMSAQQNFSHEILQQKLAENYLRIDHFQTPPQQEILGMDIASPQAVKIILKMAEESFEKYKNNSEFRKMISSN